MENKENVIDVQPQELKKYIQFKDKDYILRAPSSEFISYKSIETHALSASFTNPH